MPSRDLDIWLNLRARDKTANVFNAIQAKSRSLFAAGSSKFDSVAGIVSKSVRAVNAVNGAITPLVKRYGAVVAQMELLSGKVSDNMKELSAGAAGISAEIEYVAQKVKESNERVDAENELIAAKSARLWGALRLTVTEVFNDMKLRAADWSGFTQKAVNLATKGFIVLMQAVDFLSKSQLQLESITRRLGIAFSALRDIGPGYFEGLKAAAEFNSVLRQQYAEKIKNIDADGRAAQARQLLIDNEKELERVSRTAQERRAREGQVGNIGSTNNPPPPRDEIDQAQEEAAEKEAEMRKKMAEERRRRLAEMEAEERAAQEKLKNIYTQYGDSRIEQAANDAAEFTAKQKALYTEYAQTVTEGEEMVREQIRKTMELQKQRAAQWETVLNTVSGIFGAMASLRSADADLQQQQLSEELERIEKQKKAYMERADQAGQLGKRESEIYANRVRSFVASENRIKQRQESAERDAQKSAKKNATLQALVSTAAAYAAAAKAGSFAAGAGPAAFFAGFGSVLTTALTGVAAIKKACAQIGGGGAGAAGAGGSAGAGGGTGGSLPAGVSQPAQQLVDQPEPTSDKPNVTINFPEEDQIFYSADQIRRLRDSLRLYGAIA